MENKIMLEWNVDYHFRFNPFYPTNLKLIFTVPISRRVVYMSLNIEDNVTRTIWLLANGAQYFPVAVGSVDEAYTFRQIAGRENCAVYPCEGIYHAWLQQSGHLLPTIPE